MKMATADGHVQKDINLFPPNKSMLRPRSPNVSGSVSSSGITRIKI